MKNWVSTYSNRPQPSEASVPDQSPTRKPRERPARTGGTRRSHVSHEGNAGLASSSDFDDGASSEATRPS